MTSPANRRMPPCAACGHVWPLHIIPGGVENLDIYPHERHCVDCACRNYVEPKEQAGQSAEERRGCKAEEWQRDGRGLWAMRRCLGGQGHAARHSFTAWEYNVTPPAALSSAPPALTGGGWQHLVECEMTRLMQPEASTGRYLSAEECWNRLLEFVRCPPGTAAAPPATPTGTEEEKEDLSQR